jgi:hypothetical protein
LFVRSSDFWPVTFGEPLKMLRIITVSDVGFAMHSRCAGAQNHGGIAAIKMRGCAADARVE